MPSPNVTATPPRFVYFSVASGASDGLLCECAMIVSRIFCATNTSVDFSPGFAKWMSPAMTRWNARTRSFESNVRFCMSAALTWLRVWICAWRTSGR